MSSTAERQARRRARLAEQGIVPLHLEVPAAVRDALARRAHDAGLSQAAMVARLASMPEVDFTLVLATLRGFVRAAVEVRGAALDDATTAALADLERLADWQRSQGLA